MLKLRAIELAAQAKDAEYGALLEFPPGLTVISAENTRGKSTLVQAIIFALGLEKMLSPRREVPLPRVMTVELQETVGGPDIPVLASQVLLEVENGKGDVITLQRSAKGPSNLRLVSVFHGPQLTDRTAKHKRSDFYALDPGAAQSSTGLHTFLASYLGWDLPSIPRFNGGDSPLYLEALFALFFVEQKVGWSAIPANFPTYMGLRDMSRRAVEYVLGLQIHEIEVARQRIESRVKSSQASWIALVEEANRLAGLVSGRVEGMPTDPDLNWMEDSTYLFIPEGKEWVSVEDLASRLEQALKEERATRIPTAGKDTREAGEELARVLLELETLRATRHELTSNLTAERAQQRATVRRLRNIQEDLQRHKDAAKILSIGGEIGLSLNPDRCPTCHQRISDTLLGPDAMDQPMSLEDNHAFLLKQRDLFSNLQARSASLVGKQEKEVTLLGERIARSYARQRALQDTLGSASETPSTAAIQHRVELQARLDSLGKVNAAFSRIISHLAAQREEFRAIKAEEEALPPPGLPRRDKERLRNLRASIVSQLVEYGFSTFRAEDIQLAEDAYRPIREGFEIGFELSASDAIRLKWAYQLALLESTNDLEEAHHPGLLIFDEPRQQETAPVSFHSLVARASRIPKNLQILFTTSEDKATLRRAIAELDLHFIDLTGYLLQRR